MVLTRRASKCIFRWLPNEILSEIIGFLSPDSGVLLCRVSKLLHGLVCALLYRAVELDSYTQLRLYHRSLTLNPANGQHVRSLALHMREASLEEEEIMPQNYSVFNTMSRLQVLEVHLPPTDKHCIGIFRDSTFPELSRFEYFALVSSRPVFNAFLARHPTILGLVVSSFEPDSEPDSATPVPATPLPKLRYYIGPPFLVDVIPRGIPIVSLVWPTQEMPRMNDVFRQLSVVTTQGTQLTFLARYTHTPMVDIFAALALHLPHTECLDLRGSKEEASRWRLEPEYIDCVAQSLLRFTALQYLALEYAPFHYPAEQDVTADRSILTRWAGNCASLNEVCFHGNAWRKVDRDWALCAPEDLKTLSANLLYVT